MSKAEALALTSTNVEKHAGVKTDELQSDLFTTRGGHLAEFSKVVVVVSLRRGGVYVRPFGLSLYVRWCLQQSPNLILE